MRALLMVATTALAVGLGGLAWALPVEDGTSAKPPRSEATNHVDWAAAGATSRPDASDAAVISLTDDDLAGADRRLIEESLADLADRGAALAARAKVEVDSPAYAADWMAWSRRVRDLRELAAWDRERDEATLGVPPPPPTGTALEAHLLIERERTLREELVRTEEERRAQLQASERRDQRRADERQREHERAQLAAGVPTLEWRRIAFYNQQTCFRFERLINFRLRTGHPEPLRGLPDWNVGPAYATHQE